MTAKELFLGEGFLRPIITAMYGAAAGGMAGSLVSDIKNKSDNEKLKELMVTNPVNVKEFVAKYDPEMKVINTTKDIDKQKYNKLNQYLIEQSLKNPLPEYIQGQGEMIAPEEANPYAIGHEIGHHEYEKTHKPANLIEHLLGINRLTGKMYKTEKGAWKKSPIETKEEGEEIRGTGLKTYKTLEKNFRIGAAAGAAIGAGVSIPYLLKYLRK